MNRKTLTILVTLTLFLSFGFVSAQAKEVSSGAENSNASKWGTPSQVISNSDQQRSYDAAESSKFSDIQVFGTEVMPFRTASKNAALVPGGKGDLTDHGGSILPNSNIYSIYWGPSFAQANYSTSVKAYLATLACATTTCTGLSNTVKQYFRTASGSMSIAVPVKNYSDTTAPPTKAPSTSAIVAEVAKVVNAAGDLLDPKGLYLVYTSNFPTKANYCAWHSAGSAKNKNNVTTSFAVGYMPYVGSQLSGCGASYLPSYTLQTGHNSAVDSVLNVTTHEIYEALTDSIISGNGWYDAAGYENGDKCAWNWSTNFNGYWVQQEYSNSTHNCAAN